MGWGVGKDGERKEGDLVMLWCSFSDFGPDPAECPFRCCLKLLCGPPSGPVC